MKMEALKRVDAKQDAVRSTSAGTIAPGIQLSSPTCNPLADQLVGLEALWRNT